MTPDPMRDYGRALLALRVALLVGDPRLYALAARALREARA